MDRQKQTRMRYGYFTLVTVIYFFNSRLEKSPVCIAY